MDASDTVWCLCSVTSNECWFELGSREFGGQDKALVCLSFNICGLARVHYPTEGVLPLGSGTGTRVCILSGVMFMWIECVKEISTWI